MKIINLYGGPGTSKSTTATGLFNKMKKAGYKCEYVHEYAKDLTYKQSWKVLEDQGYLFSKQHHKLWILKDSVDYIITDSPLLLGLVYIKGNSLYDTKEFKDYVRSIYKAYDTIDVFLERNIEVHPYQTYGRSQTLEEAIKKDAEIKSVITEFNPNFYNVKVQENTEDIILDIIRG
jgi:hypothetical protein